MSTLVQQSQAIKRPLSPLADNQPTDQIRNHLPNPPDAIANYSVIT